MFSVLILSTCVVFVSAANETLENNFVTEIGGIIVQESIGAGNMLAYNWNSHQMTDQQSIDKFLSDVTTTVFLSVDKDVTELVKNALGDAVIQPKKTEMYKVLEKLVKRYTTQLILSQATAHTNNTQIANSNTRKGKDDKLSQIIASLYEKITTKNVTAEEKSKLLEKSQKQIDAFIKTSIKADKPSKSKVASRSGSFFFNQYLHQQQEKSSSSLALKLTQQMMNSMCTPPQPSYINSCHLICPLCSHCVPGHGPVLSYGGSNSYDGTSPFDISGNLFKLDTSGTVGHGSISAGTAGGYSNYGTIGNPGLSGDTLIGGGSSGIRGSYSENSDVRRSYDLSSTGSLKAGYSGYGSQIGDIKGYYSGISNLWSLGKTEVHPAKSGITTYADCGNFPKVENFQYAGTSCSEGTSNIAHPGGLTNSGGAGSLGGGGRQFIHYSSSNSQSSSSNKADSSSSHVSYSNA